MSAHSTHIVPAAVIHVVLSTAKWRASSHHTLKMVRVRGTTEIKPTYIVCRGKEYERERANLHDMSKIDTSERNITPLIIIAAAAEEEEDAPLIV